MQSRSSHEPNVLVAEMKEFAGFKPGEQRYIKRSLDIALSRRDAEEAWGRDANEKAAINAQITLYDMKLEQVGALIPKSFNYGRVGELIEPLVIMSAFDLAQGQLSCFSSYRFLYERLFTAEIRQWLPSAFCCAAAMPHLKPDKRKDLLQSISEAAATAPGWSAREPFFFPEWIDKETV